MPLVLPCFFMSLHLSTRPSLFLLNPFYVYQLDEFLFIIYDLLCKVFHYLSPLSLLQAQLAVLFSLTLCHFSDRAPLTVFFIFH